MSGSPPAPERADGGPRRVLLVTDVYPPDCGGSGWSTHALATALQDRGVHVEVLETDTRAEESVEREYDGIPIRTEGVGSSRSLRRRLEARDFSFASVRAAVDRRLAAEPRIEVVHGQHLHSGPPVAAAAVDAGRGAVITLRDHWPVCLHGTHWWGGTDCPGCSRANLVGCMREYLGFHPLLGHLMVPWARRRLAARQAGIARAHRVTAVSETLRARIAARLPGQPLQVVPNIVDPGRSERAAERGRQQGGVPGGPPPRFLLAAGKLNAVKGFDRLVPALASVGDPPPVLVAGTGPLEERLVAEARQSGVDLRPLGWVSHEPLLALVRAADAVLLPSRWEEPLSRLILEAMSLGTPVIAWSTGSAREVIDSGVNGWLVDDQADLEAAMAELREDGVALRVGRAALETVRARFAPEVVVPRILAVYGEAMDAVR